MPSKNRQEFRESCWMPRSKNWPSRKRRNHNSHSLHDRNGGHKGYHHLVEEEKVLVASKMIVTNEMGVGIGLVTIETREEVAEEAGTMVVREDCRHHHTTTMVDLLHPLQTIIITPIVDTEVITTKIDAEEARIIADHATATSIPVPSMMNTDDARGTVQVMNDDESLLAAAEIDIVVVIAVEDAAGRVVAVAADRAPPPRRLPPRAVPAVDDDLDRKYSLACTKRRSSVLHLQRPTVQAKPPFLG